MPCGGSLAFWLASCLTEEQNTQAAGWGGWGQVGWGRGRANTRLSCVLEAQGEHWPVRC